MAGELLHKRPRWWPPISDWFEDFPVDFRLSPDEHVIRVEESQEEGAYVIKAEIPGMDPQRDVEIMVDGGVLTIHAERSEEKTEKHRSEFRYGSFTRSIRLPAGADEKKISASYDKGVLTVRAPMAPEAEGRARRIEVMPTESGG